MNSKVQAMIRYMMKEFYDNQFSYKGMAFA